LFLLPSSFLTLPLPIQLLRFIKVTSGPPVNRFWANFQFAVARKN